MQHLAEGLARLVSQVQALAELGASGSVNSADVFDVCVDARAQRGALGQGRDAAGGGDLHDAEDVDDDELDADGEQHGRGRHGEDADRRVVGACAAVGCQSRAPSDGGMDVRNQLNHDEEPADGEIPVEPVELSSVSAWSIVDGVLLLY